MSTLPTRSTQRHDRLMRWTSVLRAWGPRRGSRLQTTAWRAAWVIVSAALATLLAAGCGARAAGNSSSAVPVPTATAVPTALADAIKERLTAQSNPLLSSSEPSIQTAAEVRADSGGSERGADTLDAAGTEDLTTKVGNHGIRVVFHFPDAAKAMASYQRATRDSAGTKTAFTIPGVPNSSATEDLVKGGCGCRDVDFVIGEYEYRLGLSTDLGDSPTRAQFIAMTQAWYANLTKLG